MIEKSLTLLNTDHIDLWQLHDIGLPEDVNAVFAPDGAMKALLEMQQQNVVRFLGVTGHYRPEALISMTRPLGLRLRKYPCEPDCGECGASHERPHP